MKANSVVTFQGRTLSKGELSEINEIIETCRGLSRTELASTICELFSWTRSIGRLKTVECRQFLERLDADGLIGLPPQRKINSNALIIPFGDRTNFASLLLADVSSLPPLSLHKVTTKAE